MLPLVFLLNAVRGLMGYLRLYWRLVLRFLFLFVFFVALHLLGFIQSKKALILLSMPSD